MVNKKVSPIKSAALRKQTGGRLYAIPIKSFLSHRPILGRDFFFAKSSTFIRPAGKNVYCLKRLSRLSPAAPIPNGTKAVPYPSNWTTTNNWPTSVRPVPHIPYSSIRTGRLDFRQNQASNDNRKNFSQLEGSIFRLAPKQNKQAGMQCQHENYPRNIHDGK